MRDAGGRDGPGLSRERPPAPPSGTEPGPRAEPALGVVEGLVLRPGARDVAALAVPVLGSVGRLARALLAARDAAVIRLGLVTGTYLAWPRRPAAETDGPVGVAALAVLCDALGIPATVVTDGRCAAVVRACLDGAGARAALRVVPPGATPDDVRRGTADLELTHLLAVEVLGPARDGRVYTMRGLDNTAVTTPLHALFTAPGITTAAVGDGGNEVGMGVLAAGLVAASVPNGALIACAVPVDHLVVAGTSNWGCYALAAALAVLDRACAPAAAGLLTASADAALIEAATAAGAVDGVRGEPLLGVDGVPAAAYAPLLEALRAVVRAGPV